MKLFAKCETLMAPFSFDTGVFVFILLYLRFFFCSGFVVLVGLVGHMFVS
jgi:hypothetical protein